MSDEMVFDAMLRNYNVLNQELSRLREDQLLTILRYELSTKRRKHFIERIHQRWAKLRNKRELTEMINGGML